MQQKLVDSDFWAESRHVEIRTSIIKAHYSIRDNKHILVQSGQQAYSGQVTHKSATGSLVAGSLAYGGRVRGDEPLHTLVLRTDTYSSPSFGYRRGSIQ